MKRPLIIWIVFSLMSSSLNIYFFIFPNPSSFLYSLHILFEFASIQSIFDIFLMALSQQLGIWYEVLTMAVLSLIIYISIRLFN